MAGLSPPCPGKRGWNVERDEDPEPPPLSAGSPWHRGGHGGTGEVTMAPPPHRIPQGKWPEGTLVAEGTRREHHLEVPAAPEIPAPMGNPNGAACPDTPGKVLEHPREQLWMLGGLRAHQNNPRGTAGPERRRIPGFPSSRGNRVSGDEGEPSRGWWKEPLSSPSLNQKKLQERGFGGDRGGLSPATPSRCRVSSSVPAP